MRRLLVRGLAPAPLARHASMTDLLAALSRAESAPRRWGLGAAVALGAAAMVAALLWRSSAPRRCTSEHAAASLRGVWEASMEAQLESSFRGTGRAHARETAGRVRGVLERYRDEWTAMHVDSCRATHERGEQSAAMLDLRTRCLGQRREALRAVVAQLSRATDGEIVDHAVQAALGLPAVAECADTAALDAVVPLPAGTEQRAAVI
ncbi:MAG: serine/threonine protein kinase, partial [Myxococcales bacterium]|nr:serine/threonine protein kinase [Myxococcales bacterium]